jgi:hypothetical protein
MPRTTKARPRERIGKGSRARFVRRDESGQFTSDQTSVGRSLTADRRRKAKTTVKKGFGDRGDRRG